LSSIALLAGATKDSILNEQVIMSNARRKYRGIKRKSDAHLTIQIHILRSSVKKENKANL